jgi:Bacterial Ig-like domain (group 3)
MFGVSFSRFFRNKKNQPIRKANKPQKRVHLQAELLEDRVVPATISQWDFSVSPTPVLLNGIRPDNSGGPSDVWATNNGPGFLTTLGMTNTYDGNTNTVGDDILLTTGGPGDYTLRVRGSGANGWAQGAPQDTQGIQIDTSTVGYTSAQLTFDWFTTTHGIANMQIQYTDDYTQATPTWTTITGQTGEDSTYNYFTAVSNGYYGSTSPNLTINIPSDANNDPTFAIRLVSVYYQNTGLYGDAANPTTPYSDGSGNWRFGNVAVSGTLTSGEVTTTTSLAVTPASPQPQGVPITFTATVNPTSGTVRPSAGSVEFFDGQVLIGSTSTFSNGSGHSILASISSSTLASGNHYFWAEYVPAGVFTGSIGTSTSSTNPYIISNSISTTSLITASPAPPVQLNTPITFTDTITPGYGTSFPTGSVIFYDGALADPISGSIAVTQVGTTSQGMAQLPNYSSLTAGTHNIFAVFTATGNYVNSTSPALGYSIYSGSSGAFTPGNLVILQSGDESGANYNAQAPLYLDEETTAGIGVQQVVIPAVGAASITTAVQSGGTVTITTGDAPGLTGNGFTNGEYIAVNGLSQYNGTYPITTTGTNTFTYSVADNGAVTVNTGATATPGQVGNQPITIDASAAAGNGQLNRSYDGSALSFDGVDSTINNGGLPSGTTPTGSSNRVVAVVTGDANVTSNVNTTTYGPFYVGDDNRGSIAETPAGPLYTAGHPNQAGGAVSQGVHEFDSTNGASIGAQIGNQVSASTNIRGVTIGFDNRMYFSTAGGLGGATSVNGGGIFTEVQPLPNSATTTPANDIMVVPSIFSASKLGGIFLADMNGDGIIDNGDRLYFLDDGTVGGIGTGGLYVATWNDGNTQNAWNTPNNAAALAAGFVDHWSVPVRLGDAPVQTGSGGVGQLRGLTGTVVGSGIASASESTDGTNTVTITLAGSNQFQQGQSVQISGVGAGYDGSWTISQVNGNTIQYIATASGLATVNNPTNGVASQAILYTTAFDNTAFDSSIIQQWVDTNTGVSVANAQVVSTSGSNATVQITTATANTFQTGQVVEVDGVGANTGAGAITSGYNGTWTITVIDSTHFTYTDNNSGATSLNPVNNQGAADVTIQTNASQAGEDQFSNLGIGSGPGETLGGTIIQALSNNVDTIGGKNYAAIGLRGVSFAPVATTIVTLAQSPANPLEPGTSVTLTATLTNTEVTPTGEVAFIDDNTGTVLGFGAIGTVSGVTSASLTLPTGVVGNHYVHAYFAGGGTLALASAKSNTIQIIENGDYDTLTVVSPSLSAVAIGHQLTLTAHVTTSAAGATNATGTVSFFTGSVGLPTLLGSSTLNSTGQATLNVAFPAAGAQTIYAVYNGDNTYESSEGSTTVTVAANASATITSSGNNVSLNSVQTYTATITGNATLGSPGGSVTFNIVSATTQPNGTGQGVPDLNVTSSAITLTAGSNNTATAVWTGPALAYPGSYLVTITYSAASGGPYSGFAITTASANNGNAFIETVQKAFTPGDFVVIQRGDGTVNLGSNSYLVFADEYAPNTNNSGSTTAATLVQAIAMPNVDAGTQHALFLSGQNGAEGLLNLSANGYFLTLGGYDLPAGRTFITSTFPYQYPRSIAEINGAANVDTSTAIGTLNGTGTPVTITAGSATSTSAGATVTLTFSSSPSSFFVVGQQVTVSGITTAGYNGSWIVTAVTGTTVKYVDSNALGATTAVLGSTPLISSPASVPYNPNDVVSNDGNEFWITTTLPVGDTTDSGIGYVANVGATTETEIGPISTGASAVSISGGQLYITKGTGDVQAVGTGLPTTAGQTLTGLPGLYAAYQTFFPNSENPEQVLLLNTNDGTSNNPNVAYIADQSNGLLKFYFDGTNWQYGASGNSGNQQGFFGQKVPGSGGVTGVTGYVINPGSTDQGANPTEIELFVTASNVKQANPNQTDSFLDTHAAPLGSGPLSYDNGFNSGSFNVLAWVGGATGGGSPNGNMNFAGIAFVPGYVSDTKVTESTDGTNYTFTATVTTPSASSNVPGGAVYFYLNGSSTPLGTGLLVNGVATLTVPNSMIPTGSNTITAAYKGDVKDGTSTGVITWSGIAFTSGNLVATLVGTGSGALTSSGTATYINEYATGGGAAVQSIALPSSGTNPFTEKGTTTTQGYLTDSADGHSVTIGGYQAAAGSSTTGANAEIGVVGPYGTVDTSTQLSASDTGNGVTATVSADGLGMWVATANYLRYVPFDNNALTATTQVSNYFKAPSVAEIQAGNGQTGTGGVPGQIYVTGGAGAQSNGIGALDGPAQINGGLATVAGQSGTILGTGATTGSDFNVGRDANGNFPATNQIAVSPDGLNIFVADSRTSTTNGTFGGILWYYDISGSGSWTLLGHTQVTSGATADTGLLALVADWSGVSGTPNSGPVTLYATTTATSANRIVMITGFTLSGNPSYTTPTFTTVETAPANTAFRGVAFAPTAPGVQAPVSTVLNVTNGNYPGMALSATVTGDGTHAVTGYVSFQTSTGVEIGSAPVINGVATLTPSSDMQVPDSGNLVAVYSGDSLYAAQTSAPVSATASQGTPTVTLTPQFTSVATGVVDTLTAQVTYSGSNAAPTGTVTFWQDAIGAGGINLGTFPLTQTIVKVGGVPTIEFLATGATDTFTSTGVHAMYAVYSGDGNFQSQPSSPTSVTVTLPSTTTVTTNMADPTASPSQSVTLTATVTGSGGTPTGTVAFYDNTLLIQANVPLDVNGQATVTLNTSLLQQAGITLLPGLQSITAVYSGDSTYFQSSGDYEQAVQAQTFGAGDQFVYRVGDGTTSLIAPNGNPNANTASIGSTIYIDEINPSLPDGSNVVQSIILPSADGMGNQSTIHAIVGNGQQSATEQLTVSGAGDSLWLTGYDTNPLSGAQADGTGIGTTAPAIPTAAGSLNRSVARIGLDGSVQDVAMTPNNSGSGFGNFNGVYSPDGRQFYLTGAANTGFSEVIYYSSLTPSAGLVTPTASETSPTGGTGLALEPMGSNLALVQSGSSGPILAYSGFPTSAASASAPTGITSANATSGGQASTFYVDAYFTHLDFANGTAGPAGINTMYLSDDGSNFAHGAITKWALVNGTWQVVDHIIAGTGNTAVSFYYISGTTVSENYGSVTADSWGDVTLDVSYGNGGNTNTGPGYLYQIVDDNGYDAAIGTGGSHSDAATQIAHVPSGSNMTYRGVATFGAIDLTGSGTPVTNPVQGSSFTDQVATFVDPDDNTPGSNEPVGNYSATITWGDGTSSAGTIAFTSTDGSGSHYTVSGTHTYALDTAPGAAYPITVTISETGWGGRLILNTTAVVAEAGVGFSDLTGTGVTLNNLLQQSPSTATVATFNDPVSYGGTANPGSDYTATINWGDGSATSTGTVTLIDANGDYSVSGTHTYPVNTVTPFPITVTISENPPALDDQNLVVNSSANVLDAFDTGDMTGTAIDISATAGVPFSGAVANFIDPAPYGGTAEPVDQYVATIDWGDGTPTSAGTITITNNTTGAYSVSGTHTYATAGNYTATVSMVEIASPDQATVYPAVTVSSTEPAPTITNVVINQDISALYNAAGQPFAGAQRSMVNDVVYTFSEAVSILDPGTDPNVFTVAVASGWTGTAPTLNWTAVAGSGDTQWAVTFTGGSVTGGSIANGAYTITVTDPGSITAESDGQAVTVTPGTAPGTGNPDYATQQFYRLFGDINGDEFVNAADNVKFKNALATYNAAFDFSQDGFVNASDNVHFKADLTVNFSGFTPTI